MTQSITIPDKLYFKIGEVSELIGVEAYVLRYWETEFPQLSPVKSRTGQRLYKRHEVETIVAIRELLYDQKFTISGAKKKLKEIQRVTRSSKNEAVAQMPLNLEPSEDFVQKNQEAKKVLAGIVTEMNEFLKT